MSNVPITKFAADAPFNANASPGAAKLIGFRMSEFGGGEAVVELDSSPQHYNPMGTVHRGVLCDITDAAIGVAFASTLDADQSFTTMELKINFLQPVWESRLQAKARVTSRGGLIECDVTDANGRIRARTSSTCFVLREKMAEGR